MRIVLIVPDGVAVRNYLYSSFVNELQAKGFEVILYHQISNAAIEEVRKVQPTLSEIKSIPYFTEKPKARILRESLAYARLKFNAKKLNNPTVMDFWNRKQKKMKQKILYRFAEVLGTILSLNYKFILKFEVIYDKEIRKDRVYNEIEKDIETLNPDYVLNLHQRAPISAPIIAAAKKKNISTATVIFSWDNVPKARLISRYDKYLVWSDIMKTELLLLYPEIKNDTVQIVGTPQFEFYFNEKYFKNRDMFFNEFGLDSNKKTICFSANDLSSPYEANYLEDVCEEISKIEESIRPQLLFRRCPVDKTTRFDFVLEKYKSIVFPVDPDWKIENNNTKSFASIYPTINDVVLLVNTVKHCDAVINLGSTMAHDFAVYNKPCLYLNYNPVNNSIFKVEMSYKFQHFRTMDNLVAVGWINSKSQIGELVKQVLSTPNEIGEDKITWMQTIVQFPLENNSKSIVNSILK